MTKGTPAMRVFALLAIASVFVVCDESTAAQTARLPGQPGRVMLIRNTLTAVNHGTMTGNFTVLRDLASERFRKQNTAGDLAATFANLKKLDLSPILVSEPVLTKQPALDQFHGRLQLVGYVPTRPKAVRFVLVFQHVDEGWLIDGITLGVAPVETTAKKEGAQINTMK